jgi:peptidoglycan/LPS O-acetylase OafA/YrhL
MRQERSNRLDMVRGIAIFMVVAFHYFPNQVTNIGWTGVNLFFVLSGFLIGGILIDNRASDTYYVTFYGRRCFRIIPLYALNVLLFAAIVGLDQPFWRYAFFLQNFTWISEGRVSLGWMSPTWSLAAEEQFYLILPALIRLTPLRRIPHVAGALILAAPAYRLFMTQVLGSDWPAANLLLPGCLDSLFLGVLAAWVVREPRMLATLQRRRSWLWSLSGIGILGLVALFYDPPDPRSWLGSASISWIALTYALIFLGVVIRPGKSGATHGPLCALGVGAYSIYLFHMPVALAAESLIPGKPTAHTLALLAVGIGAAVCWYAIERPLISFARRRWRYDPREEAAPAAVAVAVAP